MTIYADTSFLVAAKFRKDTHHRAALPYCEAHQDEVWLWSPWHRVEVFNSLRQNARDNDPAKGLTESEAKAVIHQFEADIRCDYLVHMEADWRDVLQTANEMSVAHAFSLPCRAADLLHVAYARELGAEMFVSFDDDQVALAKAAGLKATNPAAG
jgi:predicted nucleic acid-binding protein